jgi:hypothetical protein
MAHFNKDPALRWIEAEGISPARHLSGFDSIDPGAVPGLERTDLELNGLLGS